MSAIKARPPKIDWYKSDPVRKELQALCLHFFPGDEDMARLVPAAICELVNTYGLTDWQKAQAKAVELFDQWLQKHGALAVHISMNSAQAPVSQGGALVTGTNCYQPTPSQVGEMRRLIAMHQQEPVIRTR